MSSNAKQDSEKYLKIIACHAAALVILAVLAALFLLVETAGAYEGPYRLVVYTDKKVYLDDARTTLNELYGRDDRNVVFETYAVVLDQDGNIVRSGVTFSGQYRDVANLTHPGNSTHHVEKRRTGFWYSNLSLGTFTQIGTTGIFKTFTNPTDFSSLSNPPNLSDHIEVLINVTAVVSGTTLQANTTVLFSKAFCKTGHSKTGFAGAEHGNSQHDGVPCTLCHWGAEHQLGVHGDDGPLASEIPKVDRNIAMDSGWPIYNLGYNANTTANTVDKFSTFKSGTCLLCHGPSSGVDNSYILDMGFNADTPSPSDQNNDSITGDTRPSCSWYQGIGNSQCHASTPSSAPYGATNITQTSLQNIDWKWKQMGSGNSTSHNHTGNKANVSCEICHGNHNVTGLPNRTATGSNYLDINKQCVLCHNATGGLNITVNGGKNVDHTNPDCKACHIDSDMKIDSHLVPTAGIPNANCTECHDLGGKAPYHIDFATFNKSNYVHNNISRYPLNYNASNGSALRPGENKICWGCHGDDPNDNGKADFSEQPGSTHPSRYKNPRICEDCHQNASSPWEAPQNVAHSNNTNEVRTPGAPNCYDCHGQPAMFNTSHNDPDYNDSYKATLAYHYGTGFPELALSRGQNGYCIDFCHQNTSSIFWLEFANKENMQRPNHSAMTTRKENQSCRAEQCHAADKIHDAKMKKPTLANGTFGNANCTASGCHSFADTGMNYSFHNGVVNCTSCHMDNLGGNIHPIKYLQLDGWDFAQVNTTAANCKLCHKNSDANAVLARWGVYARKVGSQHHSEDPKNGSKWNKTIDPYWDYLPSIITFVNGWKNNSERGYITNFYAMNDTNYSAARISENTTNDVFFGSYPNNHDFNSTSMSSGWVGAGTATVINWSNLPDDGNPSGSIIVASTTKSQAVDTNWTASFVYDKVDEPAQAILKIESKFVNAKNINTGALKAINVSINDGFGNITEVYNRTLPNTAETDWIESGELDIPNPTVVFWKNGTSDHMYNISIRTRWTGLGGSNTPDIKVAYDNIYVNISEKDYKKYNFTFYINETPNSDNLYNLVIGYQAHTEIARLFVLNGSNFEYKADLDSGAFTKEIVPLSKQEYNNGNVTIRINDSNGPGNSSADVDVKADYLDIEYMFIESYQWVNNSRLNYPCEYCHSSNKHFEHALGIPYEFKGDNKVGQDVNETTSWCASCHYQGYQSGGKDYNDVVQAFLSRLLPVPPEITGHTTYGVNDSINSEYYEHSGLSNFNDSKCFECHKGGLETGVNSTIFMHNVSEGTSGGRNCTACHNITSPGGYKKVNFTSISMGMHGALNKNATGNATNKPCWGCHGVLNGTWANESDQPEANHDDTYNEPRKCNTCHNDTNPLFNAKPVTDHIPKGSPATDVNTSKYNNTQCAYCHNNSLGEISDPDGFGVTGGSAMNASSAHYGANKTKGKLMAAANNTTDCAFCHKNTSNMAKWGILSGSLSNISNKNGTLNTGFNHNQYNQSSQCYQCHGGTVSNFHLAAMSPGEKGNADCVSCHNVSSPGNYLKVDFTAINLSVHGSLNKQSSAFGGNITNKPCWGCHGTKNGSYANQSDQPPNDHNSTYKSSPRKCEDCHINGTIQFDAPGLSEHIMPGKNVSTEINVTEGYCTVCHNNSITSNSDIDGSVMNASAAHYAKDANNNLMSTVQHSDNCTYCHFVNNGSSAWLTPRKPLTSTHSSYTNDTLPTICWGCHVDSPGGEPSTFHVQEINKGAGSGPNCKSCHNISVSGSDKGHIDYPAFNTSIHGGINTSSGAANDPDNEPCWACHGNGNSEGHNKTGDASGKGKYTDPYVCADCHVSTGVRYAWAIGKGALNVSEHFTNGTKIKASYNSTTTFSCLKCHQDIGEMRLNNSDIDYNITSWTSGGDSYNNTIGGNNSPYHYGRKRTDIRNGTSTNCTYCHQNSSTAFASAMQNPTINKSIYEHTDNGSKNVTGRACIDAGCHDAGFIHNSTLTKPVVTNWTQGKYDYCAPCHREGGISTKKVRGHNTSNISTPGMDCGYCHNASSQGQATGALRIHSTRLTNKSTANSTCETCHRDVTYVPASRIIKTHYPNATTEKGNTSESGRTCELCHGISVTNKLHQNTVKKPNYDCQSCHRNGYKTSPYNATTAKATIDSFMHDNETHAPTNQSGCERCHNTTNRQEIFHFTDYANGTSVAPGWTGWNNGTQANCIDCHRNKTNQAPFYALFSSSPTHTNADLDGCYNCHAGVPTYTSNPKALHSVEQAPGNANCTLCHDLAGEASKKVDVAAMNKSDSIHINLNKDATVVKASPSYAGDSKRCWACHGNGSEPSGHPANFKNAYKCADCHVPSGGRNTNYTPNNTILNVTEHYGGGSDIKTAAATYCTECHNKTEMLKTNSDIALSAVNPANDSVSHYGRNRSEIRSGINTSCAYCHQNLTTAFENVMLSSLNKSISEHTDSGTRNTSAGNCTSSKCHATGYIHNSTLTKPAVSNWTQGSKDYCAPCHKVSATNATKYVYAHNTSNISNPGMDCGYCHNASSQGQTSTGALRIHSIQLTNTSATNTTCTACHRDSKYVGASRVINTHYPGAPAGKANTSLSTWDCEECHGWSYGTKMHNQGLIKKPNYDCNSCHNASGASQYKANSTPFVNVTRHDNTSLNGANINCNSCHNNTNRPEPFHFTQWSNGTAEAPGWGGWVNGTRANCTLCHVTYANQAPFYAEPSSFPSWHKGNYGSTLNDCYQCHSNLTVLSASDNRAPVEMHNVTRAIDWGNCNACHAPKYGGAPKVDNASLSAANSMHATIDGATASNINPACKACHGGNVSIHKNSSANSCTYCHVTGKTKYGAKNVSEHIINGSYAGTTVNTSRYQQVFCDLCHNNSIAGFSDDTQGGSNATTAHYGQNRTAGKLMSGSVNSTDCVYCHKNGSNMAAWGILSTSNANINNRGDHNAYSANSLCYECHVDTKAMPVTFHAEELNQGVGSNPNCINCHSVGSSNKNIDFTATNASNNIHSNLNSGANAGGYDSANKPCWACHGNGTATAHINTTYKSPRLCESCHINASAPYGALQVKEHFRNGSEIKATSATNNTRSCLACHQNISEMLLSNNDPDAGSFDAEGDGINGTNISPYHYGKKRTDLRSGANTSCQYCHQNISTAFPLTESNRSIYEHTNTGARNTTGVNCTGSNCHSTGLIHESNLTKPVMQVWTPGSKDYCAPCHRPGNPNATRYVYSHNTTATPIGDDCGYCHNSSSQGINGSIVKLHSPTLTNSTSPVIYSGCQGCHNATATYVGSAKQIFSHMPNASQYSGNTSTSDYDCNSCHNMSGKPSMHSMGMNRSNGTCDTCHFNRTSPFKSTQKVIVSNDYNHTYAGVKTCNVTQCHNASGAAKGFHFDTYAAGIIGDPERVNSIWSDRNDTGNGFTDTLYVDCIDCHRQHNNTYPFTDSVGYEANITGENKKVHLATDSIDSCYNCHTNRSGSSDRYMVHNVTIEPLEGGPACIRCHNLSAPYGSGWPTNRVNHTLLNNSVHGNLSNYTLWNNSKKPNSVLLDSACWSCHATDITNVPSNSHPDRGGPSAERAFQCEECHTIGGNISNFNLQIYENATKVFKHSAGLTFANNLVFNSSKECFECHKNSLTLLMNITYAENYKYTNEANVSHYGNRTGLFQTNEDKNGCKDCHSMGQTGKDYGNARIMPTNHSRMGGSPTPCQVSCHNSDQSVNITLHDIKLGIFLGTAGCFGVSPCHTQPSTGNRTKR